MKLLLTTLLALSNTALAQDCVDLTGTFSCENRAFEGAFITTEMIIQQDVEKFAIMRDENGTLVEDGAFLLDGKRHPLALAPLMQYKASCDANVVSIDLSLGFITTNRNIYKKTSEGFEIYRNGKLEEVCTAK